MTTAQTITAMKREWNHIFNLQHWIMIKEFEKNKPRPGIDRSIRSLKKELVDHQVVLGKLTEKLAKTHKFISTYGKLYVRKKG